MKMIPLILAFSLVSVIAYAQPAMMPPAGGENSGQPKLTPEQQIQQLKQKYQEAETKLLTEEPKDATQAVMAVNKCMEKTIDQKASHHMNAQSRAFDKQVKELCKAGQEAEAKELQKQYAAQFAASKEYQAMKACVDKYKATFYDDAAFENTRKSMARADANKAVCDKKKAEQPNA
jgi:hypothetical protein